MTPAPLPNLSVAIVCKDNIATIWRTIESVHDLASEIVAIDSGSTDGTIELLERRGVRVIKSDWLGHIKTKQKALEACTREWVLCLDSDESIDVHLVEAVRDIVNGQLKGPTETDGWEVLRVTFYKGQPLWHVWQPEWRLRLVRRGKAQWGGFDPHDQLRMIGGARANRLNLWRQLGKPHQCFIRHDSFPTFSEHMRKQWSHATTMAKSLHAAGQRGSYARLLISPPGAFIKQTFLKRGFLDGYPGWLAGASAAVAALVKHATLIELDHTSDAAPGTSER